MLYTNLHHIESAPQLQKVLSENDNVMIICGRMGSLSIPVYRIASALEPEYPQVKFFDMEYDNPESAGICQLASERGVQGMPVIVYYKNGALAYITAGMTSGVEIKKLLDQYFGIMVNA